MRATKAVPPPFGFMMLVGKKARVGHRVRGLGVPRNDRDNDRHYSLCIASSYPL
jgi:hypothetical protein